jgi:AI-2E family transporter
VAPARARAGADDRHRHRDGAGEVIIAGIVTALVQPVASQGAGLVKSAPDAVKQAAAGHGPVGDLLTRLHVQKYVTDYVRDHPDLTVQTKQLAHRRDRVERVASDCGRAVTGYRTGNLVISVIAGLITWISLLILGVPYAGVLAILVALTDLIPLVGATIGAVLVTIVAFVHGTTPGIVMAVVFVVYQQLENHLLQPVIMGRTVKLNPLIVLISVLLGVELAGRPTGRSSATQGQSSSYATARPPPTQHLTATT